MLSDAPQTLCEPDFDYTGLYTYADYLRWTIEERVELIRGKVFRMSPAPSAPHQVIAGNIHAHLWSFLRGQLCQTFSAPFDVRLPRKSNRDEDILTVVQPDVCVICDPRKIEHRGCLGAPDLVVEVLSPANSKKELKNKYEVYEESGVRDYWIVYPEQRVVHIYRLNDDGRFVGLKPFAEGDVLETPVLPGLRISVDEVFERVID